MNAKKMSFHEFQEIHEKMGSAEFINNLLRAYKLSVTEASVQSGVKIQNFRKWKAGTYTIGFQSLHMLYYGIVERP